MANVDNFLGSFLCIYRSFLSSIYRTGIFLWVAYLLLLLFFGGWGLNSRSLVKAYVASKIESCP